MMTPIKVQSELTKNGFSITAGNYRWFLMSGNTTLICGTQDEKVDQAISIIGEFSKKRTQMVPSTASYGVGMYNLVPGGSNRWRRNHLCTG